MNPILFTNLINHLITNQQLPLSFHSTTSSNNNLITLDYLLNYANHYIINNNGYIPYSHFINHFHLSHFDTQFLFNHLLSSNPSNLFLLDSYIISNIGISNLLNSLLDTLIHCNTCMTIDTLASKLTISTALLLAVLDHSGDHNNIYKDVIDKSYLYTKQYSDYLINQLTNELAGATEPVDLKPFRLKYNCPPGLWEETLRTISVPGTFTTQTLYTPAIYVSVQSQTALTTLDLIGYLRIERPILNTILADIPKSTWILQSTLVSATHAIQLKETLLVLMEEEPNGIEVTSTTTNSFLNDFEEAKMFVNRAFSGNNNNNDILVSKSGTFIALRAKLLLQCIKTCIDPDWINVVVRKVLDQVHLSMFVYSNFTDAASNVDSIQSQFVHDLLRERFNDVPNDMLDQIWDDVLHAFQSVLDDAMVHRAHPQLMVIHYAAKLHIHLHQGIIPLTQQKRIPKESIKVLDRHLIKRVCVPLRDAVLAFIPPTKGQICNEIMATLNHAISTKSCSVFEKLVCAIAKSQRINLPTPSDIEDVRSLLVTRLESGSDGGMARLVFKQLGMYLVLDASVPDHIMEDLKLAL